MGIGHLPIFYGSCPFLWQRASPMMRADHRLPWLTQGIPDIQRTRTFGTKCATPGLECYESPLIKMIRRAA